MCAPAAGPWLLAVGPDLVLEDDFEDLTALRTLHRRRIGWVRRHVQMFAGDRPRSDTRLTEWAGRLVIEEHVAIRFDTAAGVGDCHQAISLWNIGRCRLVEERNDGRRERRRDSHRVMGDAREDGESRLRTS